MGELRGLRGIRSNENRIIVAVHLCRLKGTLFREQSIASWPVFDEALTTCKNVWKKNQYPEEFTDGIVLVTLEKCREREILQQCWKCTQGQGNKERPLYHSVQGAGY